MFTSKGVEVRAYAPHCDSAVLHSPGSCEYCDMYPEWQHYRTVARIAFSDQQPDAYNAPCPSTYRRSAETRDRWGGNVAKPLPDVILHETP